MLSTNCVSPQLCTNFLVLQIIHPYHADLKELPFVYLDENRTSLSSVMEDSVSDPVVIQGGFPYGNSYQANIYVRTSTNMP